MLLKLDSTGKYLTLYKYDNWVSDVTSLKRSTHTWSRFFVEEAQEINSEGKLKTVCRVFENFSTKRYLGVL